MSDPAPRHVVERYLAEILNGDHPHRSPALIADESLQRRVSALRFAFPDLHVTTRHLIAEGDLVAVHLSGRGTHRGLFQGCPPTSRRWTATCTALYRVHGSRIIDSWTNWDLLTLMEQLGCVQRISTVSA